MGPLFGGCFHTLNAELVNVITVNCLCDNLHCSSKVECCILGAHAKEADVTAEVAVASYSEDVGKDVQ